jgi:hypothetical protein
MMKKTILLACAVLIASCSTIAVPEKTQATDPNSVQVMVLGSYHFKASTSDLVNLEVKSVLNPQSQKELQAIADAMASFNPNVIVTERVTDAPDYIDPYYADYGPDMLTKNVNERVQLAYRIADTANVDRVYGLDERSSEDEPDYFPFDALIDHANNTGQGEALDQMLADSRAEAEQGAAETENDSIARRLRDTNEGYLSNSEFYYKLSKYDRGETQPAAELQAYWFMRNAKIFSKLINITKPGDRVIIIYGSGHKFWFEHFLNNTPGFTSVDPVPYLISADKK